MKTLLRLALLCAALFAPLLAPALGEGVVQLALEASISPGGLVVPGEVTLTVNITNISDLPLANVKVLVGGSTLAGQYEMIAARESVSIERPFTVTQEQLDKGYIEVFTNHDGPDGEVIGNVSIAVEKVAAEPQMEFTRQLSSACQVRGGQVTLAYRVRNTGNVDLLQVSVSDALGNFTERLSVLVPGESKTFFNTVTLWNDALSEPSVSYTPRSGSASVTRRLDGAPIAQVTEGLTLSLRADASSVAVGNSVSLVATLKNTGSARISDIALTEPSLGAFASQRFSLEPGEEITLSRTAYLNVRTTFQVTAEGTSEAGNLVSAVSGAAEVGVSAAGAAVVELRAEAATPRIARAGKVRFLISLANGGEESVYGVGLYEASCGLLHTFEVVPPGEPTLREFLLDVPETARFLFTAEIAGADGVQTVLRAVPITVTIASDGAEPEPDEGRNAQEGLFAGNSTRPDTFDVYSYMVAGALVLLAFLIGLLIVTTRRERRARQQRRHQREEGRKE